jgi:hypothetical protein
VALPQFPDLPDDDPIRALGMIRAYLRAVTYSVAPWVLPITSIVSPIVIFVVALLIVGFDKAVSWGSDFVPLIFAVISIVVSVKRLRDEHHIAVIGFVLVAGIIGTGIIHYSRIHSEDQNTNRLLGLEQRVERVGSDNSALLRAYLAKPILSTQEAAFERKQGILKALRGEYVISHDNVSPGLLEGTESPPTEWINKRLRELGEQWTVTEASRHVSGTIESVKDASLVVYVSIGDDTADGPAVLPDPFGSVAPTMRCVPPFQCYSEDAVTKLMQPILVDFTKKRTRRLFFSVANISDVPVPKPFIKIVLHRREDGGEPQNATINAQGANVVTHSHGLEFGPESTRDLLPYRRNNSMYVYAVDLTIGDDPSPEVLVFFRIFSNNLPNHDINVPFHLLTH